MDFTAAIENLINTDIEKFRVRMLHNRPISEEESAIARFRSLKSQLLTSNRPVKRTQISISHILTWDGLTSIRETMMKHSMSSQRPSI